MFPKDLGSNKIFFVKDNRVQTFRFLCFMIFFFVPLIISFISNGKGVPVREVL